MWFVRRMAPVALVALAGLFVPASATVNGSLTQVTSSGPTSSQTTPAISGSLVVWNNSAVMLNGGTNHDIYWEDLSTSPLVQQNLTNTPDLQEFLEDISGTNVVFTQTSINSAGDILVADLSARTIQAAPVASADPGGAWHYEQPAISGRYIVFIKAGLTQSDVTGYDNSTGFPLPMITNDAAVQAAPRVNGDYVVFEDYGSGNADVWGYQIGHPPAFPIATGPDAQRTPDVDGSSVVWVDSDGTNDQIWLYDLNTRVSRQLTTAPGAKLNPRISGKRVVWSDHRNGDLDIYTYDLSTDTEDQLAGGAGDQMLADIDGNRVVFTSNATGFEQVYLFTIVTPPPPVVVPVGCDPTKTDPADAPVTMVRPNTKIVNNTRSFTPLTGKQYYVCVENGLASGMQRTGDFMLVVDNDVVLTPADFKPNNDPPRWVATTILDGSGHGQPPLPGSKHQWSSALFGSKIPSQVTITLRVAK